MSPYLLAFVVSDYVYSTNEATVGVGGKVHRIYTRLEAVDSTKYALNNSEVFLRELEKFVSYNYELTRVNHATVPDFYYSKNFLCSSFLA